MKTFIHLITAFGFFSFILFPSRPGLQNHAKSEINHTDKTEGKGVLLAYTGSMQTAILNANINILFKMDPSIGLRYEVSVRRKDDVVSHIGIFYKFSNPGQSTVYDFLEHKSYANTGGGNDGRGDPDVGDDPDVKVVGTETIDNYSCTHFQSLDEDKNYTSKYDFWMCKNLPGFQEIIKVQNQLNLVAAPFMINGAIFKWGGLVKYKGYEEDKGVKKAFELHLIEAKTDANFPATDFEVPKK